MGSNVAMRGCGLFGFWLALVSTGLVRGSHLRREQRRSQLSNKSATSYKQILHNYQNVQYFADFDIGGQQIAGIFDTGSFELVVQSSRCENCVHPTTPYNRKLSDTYRENGTVTKHVYGSGPCISMMGYDTVSVGPLHAEKQAFWEIVDHRIPVLDQAKFGAIVGIGPNWAFGNTEKTLLMSYGVDEFSICLQKPSGSDGFLTWGPTESNITSTKDYATAKVIGTHHWVTPLSNVTFQQPGGRLVEMPCAGETSCAAIIDSGTSLIAAPGMDLMKLSEQIPQIKEDCSNLHELPVLHFVIDGNPFQLPPQAYVMRVTGATLEADDIWDILFFKPKMRKLDMCMPAFMQIDMMSEQGQALWILGMPFFRYYHTTFDRTNKVMRFALAGPSCEPLPYRSNRTESLLALDRGEEQLPMDMDVDALIPPKLSGMMDFPFASAGELVL